MTQILGPEGYDTNLHEMIEFAVVGEPTDAESELRLLLAVVDAYHWANNDEDAIDRIASAFQNIVEQAPHLLDAARKAGETT